MAVVGGTAFRQEMAASGQAGTQAMNRLQQSARLVPPAFNAVGVQAAQMAARMAGANPAATALAGALGNAVAGATAFGIAGGVAAVALGALVPLLMNGRKSAAEMAAEMVRLEGSTGSVTSATSALSTVQRQYADAVAAQGGASSAAATAVVAASKREFAARKEVLAVELELLRVRNSERQLEIQRTAEQLQDEGEAAMQRDLEAFGQNRRPGLPEPTGFAGRRRPSRPTPFFDEFLQSNEKTRLALRKLRAEAELTKLALEGGERALNGQFKDVGGLTLGGDKPGTGGGARGGAGARAVEELRKEIESASQFSTDIASAVRSSMSSLFDAIVEGGGKAGEVIENLGKKLASMALQESVFRLLASVAPGTFGAGGFIPLVANARGNAFDAGRVTAFARGGVVSGPTMFPMRGGMTGLMGEAGPEAIMPLTRIGGRLGVAAAGGGGTMVQIINTTGQPAREERSTGPDGREMVRVVVGEEIARGSFAKPLAARHGLGTQRVARG
jgi:hypothetical protein